MPIRTFLLALLGSLAFSAHAAADKPNILLILADDLGFGDIACYNPESKVPTPHIDKLAADGMRFTDAHSPSTVCTPTRYSLLPGRMEFHTGYRGVFSGVGGPCLIEKERLTLPGILKKRGYATAMFGKWHIGLSFHDKEGKRTRFHSRDGLDRRRAESPARRLNRVRPQRSSATVV